MILTKRFWAKVEQDGDCWRWTGASSRGYGSWSVGGKTQSTHRLTYTEFRDDIPTGLSIDHLCRNKLCCNPWHLEPVTTAVNNMRRHRSWFCIHGVIGWTDCTDCEREAEVRSQKMHAIFIAAFGRAFGRAA